VSRHASRFPDPHRAPADGPLAVGGDLDPDTLLDAYRHGIFPWPYGDASTPMLWWSPDPRAVFLRDGVHVSRSLARTLRSGRFSTSVDRAFDAVVAGCADRPGEGIWITSSMAAAYGKLHRLGHAHSVEVWDRQGGLVGGIYGVAVGAAFSGESMFHRVTGASKVALVTLADRLWARGFVFLDAQLPTPHLVSMGAAVMPRSAYLDALDRAVGADVRW
jgi:leucyl/phenylalanyl-tRNA---protein transferase